MERLFHREKLWTGFQTLSSGWAEMGIENQTQCCWWNSPWFIPLSSLSTQAKYWFELHFIHHLVQSVQTRVNQIWEDLFLLEANSSYGIGWPYFGKRAGITTENFTVGVTSPTPTDLTEKEISLLIKPCKRYKQTSSTSSMTAKRSSDYLGDHEFQDATKHFASTLNQKAFHDVKFTFQSSGLPEEENSDPLKQRIYGHRNILSVRCSYF